VFGWWWPRIESLSPATLFGRFSGLKLQYNEIVVGFAGWGHPEPQERQGSVEIRTERAIAEDVLALIASRNSQSP
jgi:hypothetical protein